MCLVISGIFLYMSFSFYQSGNIVNSIVNGIIGCIFLILMVYNTKKTKKENEIK